MDEQVEHLRFDVARRAAPPQFLADDIDLAIAKGEDHHRPSRPAEAKTAKIKEIYRNSPMPLKDPRVEAR
jgi:hypothetical protein